MRHGNVRDMLQEAGIRRDADEKLELRIGCSEPEEGDQDRKDDGAHGVDPPSELASEHAGHETEAIDEEIVSVVFPQDVDLAVLVPQGPAVEEEAEFGAESDGNGDDGGQVKSPGCLVAARCECTRGLDDQDEGDSCHEEAECNVARCLDPGFTAGKAAWVNPFHGAVAQYECEVAASQSTYDNKRFRQRLAS